MYAVAILMLSADWADSEYPFCQGSATVASSILYPHSTETLTLSLH